MPSDGNHTNSTVPLLDMSTFAWVFPLFCIMALVGIFANAYLVITIYRHQSLRHAPTYAALMCLAMVDFIHLFFLIGAGIFYTYYNAKTSTMCQILVFGMYSTTGTSSYHMVIFSVLRYVILVKPFSAMKYVTVKNTLCCCLMCWLVSTCFGGLAFLTTDFLEIETSDGKTVETCVSREEGKYMDFAIFILEFYMPLTLISAFHVSKCVHLKRRSVETANTQTQKQQVSTAIMATIIILYVVCYFPMSIYVMVTLVLKMPISSYVFSLGYLFILLAPINSALNPFVYFFFTKCVHRAKEREVDANMQTNSVQ